MCVLRFRGPISLGGHPSGVFWGPISLVFFNCFGSYPVGFIMVLLSILGVLFSGWVKQFAYDIRGQPKMTMFLLAFVMFDRPSPPARCTMLTATSDPQPRKQPQDV